MGSVLEVSAYNVCDLRIGVLSGAEDEGKLSLDTAAMPCACTLDVEVLVDDGVDERIVDVRVRVVDVTLTVLVVLLGRTGAIKPR